MKNRIFFIAIVFSILATNLTALGSQKVANLDVEAQRTEILQNLATALQQQYKLEAAGLDHETNIVTVKLEEAVSQQVLLVSDGFSLKGKKGFEQWRMTIGRDILVPVFNAKNPLASELLSKGISVGQLQHILEAGEILSENGQPYQIHLLLDDFQIASSMLADFAQVNQQKYVQLAKPEDILKQIDMDVLAIGFVRLALVQENLVAYPQSLVQYLPIDRNGNGRIDHAENFYSNSNDLLRAAWLGKFPHQLVNPYFLMFDSPLNENQTAFAIFTQLHGQQIMQQAGIGMLPAFELKSNMDKLNNIPQTTIQPKVPINWFKILYFVVGILLIIVLLGSVLYKQKPATKAVLPPSVIADAMFAESKLDAPAGLLYDRTHTWSLMQKEGLVKMGVADFLLHITGAFTKIKAKKTGEEVLKGEPIVTLLQNGKELVLYAPFSGIIREVNAKLISDTSEMSRSPYQEGWIYEIEPTNWPVENRFMMMVEAYRAWIKTEFVRLRDFFATNQLNMHASLPVLQDGGEMKMAVLSEFGPEVWENFQTHFINPSR